MDFAAPPLGDQRAGWGSLDRVVETLGMVLSLRDWLAGGRFSAADLYLGTLLDWAIRFGNIAERPVFERYLARMDDRPARLRAQAMDDELAGRPIMTRAL